MQAIMPPEAPPKKLRVEFGFSFLDMFKEEERENKNI
jgi:hypothetical protein